MFLARKCMVCVSPVLLFFKDRHFSRWERPRSDPMVGQWLRVCPFVPPPVCTAPTFPPPRQWGLAPSQSTSLESVSVQLPDCEKPLGVRSLGDRTGTPTEGDIWGQSAQVSLFPLGSALRPHTSAQLLSWRWESRLRPEPFLSLGANSQPRRLCSETRSQPELGPPEAHDGLGRASHSRASRLRLRGSHIARIFT